MSKTYGTPLTQAVDAYRTYKPERQSLGVVLDRLSESTIVLLEGRLGTRNQLDPVELAVFEGLKRILSSARSKHRAKNRLVWRRTFKAFRANVGKLDTTDALNMSTLNTNLDIMERELCGS